MMESSALSVELVDKAYVRRGNASVQMTESSVVHPPPYEPLSVELVDKAYVRLAEEKVKHSNEIAILNQKLVDAEAEQKRLAQLVLQLKQSIDLTGENHWRDVYEPKIKELEDKLHRARIEKIELTQERDNLKDVNEHLRPELAKMRDAVKQLENKLDYWRDKPFNAKLLSENAHLRAEMAKRDDKIKELQRVLL